MDNCDCEIELRDEKSRKGRLFIYLKEQLDRVKGELLHTLPGRFIPYLENGTLNQPTLPKAV
ncbi:DUF4085 family protein [Cytobacillus sp. Hm23]